jgi:hypothetical protein
MELPREPETMEAMIRFLRQSAEPLPQAEPPQLVREGDVVRADQADARVHCAAGGNYPTRTTPGLPDVTIGELAVYTCYARNPKTELASPMARFLARAPARNEPLSLLADPPPGVYEHPVSIKLVASDPDAMIVYSTAGIAPDSGSPLYAQPVYVAGPLTLTAIAIAPDGRASEPLKLTYDISLERIEARHTLQRQLDPAVPERYAGERKVGR